MKSEKITVGILGLALIGAPSVSNARWMNPTTGRFQTRDSYEGDKENPLSLHKYLYCEANPMNGHDPSGHEFQLLGVMTLANMAMTVFAQVGGPALGDLRASGVATERQPASQFTLSMQGLQLIAGFESFNPRVYKDPAGFSTIGYGHKVLASERQRYANGITREQGLTLLQNDANATQRSVSGAVTTVLNQFEHDALVSFTFNVGSQNLRTSTLLSKLNRRDYDGASREFPRWVYAGGRELRGLVERRNKEQLLFRGESWRFRGELGFDPY